MGIRTDAERALYVADDPDEVVREALEASGFAVIESGDGSDAIERTEREEVDCVVAEYSLSGEDDAALCETLRDRTDAPFVLLVDSREAVAAERLLDADVSAAVSRDGESHLDRDDLVETVTATVDEYRSERERERSLERDSRMLQSVLDNLPLSIYFKNERGIHEAVSESTLCADDGEFIQNGEGKAHHHAADLVGKTDFDIYGFGAEEGVEDDNLVMEEEIPIVDKVESGTTPLGDTMHFSTTKAPQYDADGNVIGTVGVTLKVTDRIEHQQAVERQNERLEEFASVVSHDLRNPLTVAKGHLDIFASGDDDGRSLGECRTALDRMGQLIDDVLVFAREGRTVEETESVDLAATARAAWKTVDTGDATLVTDTDLPVRGDRARLTRLFENLFRNSVEHGSTLSESEIRESRSDGVAPESNRTQSDDSVEHGSTGNQNAKRSDDSVEHGAPRTDDTSAPADAVEQSTDGGTVTDGAVRGTTGITVRVGDADNDFYVEDDGVGIPEDERDDVLERGMTTSPDGTGFGLAIVRNVANAHGWDVTVTESGSGGVSDEGDESETRQTGGSGGARFEFTGVARDDGD